MAPSTRSRGAPAPSRVYHSTPALQQAQFPPRRRTVRTYGRQNQKTRDLRQQTLTQIDFVSSSFEHDAEDDLLSDATEEGDEGRDAAEDKENDLSRELPAHEDGRSGSDEVVSGREGPDDEGDSVEEEAVPSARKRRAALKEKSNHNQRTKRRRTLGDKVESKASKNSRRKTVGDPPVSSYHTQTLTQYLAKDHQLIQDSEDEGDGDNEGEDEDDSFDNWLRKPASQSPPSRQAPAESLPGLNDVFEIASQHIPSREGSIVPQTPAKRNRRAVIPSSSQLSTPLSSHLISRYGPVPDIHESPSVRGTTSQKCKQISEFPGTVPSPTPIRKKSVIEDSYATESWGSSHQTQLKRTPLKDVTADTGGAPSRAPSRLTSSSPEPDLANTPTRSRPRRDLGSGSRDRIWSSPLKDRHGTPSPIKKAKRLSPTKLGTSVREIPDSDEESDSWGDEEIDQENQAPLVQAERTLFSGSSQRGSTNTLAQKAASQSSRRGLSQASQKGTEKAASVKEDVVDDSTEGEDSDQDDQFAAGPDTLLALDQLGTSHSNSAADESLLPSPRPLQASTPREVHPIPTPQGPPSSKPIRQPLYLPGPAHALTQPLESQRVPLAVIRGLGEPAYATDILLRVSPTIPDRLASGHLVHMTLPFRIFPQVTRFWLFDGSLLRYLACPQPGVQQGPRSWTHEIDQVYELNNSCDEDDMREEEWFEGPLDNYKYLAPVIVSRLLSNLRHALFNTDDNGHDDDDDDDEQEAPLEEPIELPSDPPPSDEQPIPLPQYTSQRAPRSSDAGSVSISQQVEAQLRSESDRAVDNNPYSEDTTVVPSTPMSSRKTPRGTRKQSFVHPSQATTASVASTPEKSHSHHHHHRHRQSQSQSQIQSQRPAQQQQQHQQKSQPPPLHSLHHSSSSHLTFQDYGSSSPPLALPHSNTNETATTSQLLSKSQMIPDSLLRDESQMPPEIWSSDDEDA